MLQEPHPFSKFVAILGLRSPVHSFARMLNPFDAPADEVMDVGDLTKVWRGDLQEPYAVASVVGTIAVVLRAMGKADTTDDAQTMAQDLWDARDRDFLSARR